MNESRYFWLKRGFIYKPYKESSLWIDHAMAPAPIMIDNSTIRIFMGGWDTNNISRIYYIDVDANNPSSVKNIITTPVLDIGEYGCFDDNGVFPGHVYRHKKKIYLYYTGFQKLDKIPFSNFSGLAISADNGMTFKRVSKAPVMDRKDEGLFTRAGISIIVKDNIFHTFYAVGNSWHFVNGKNRPVYEINYITSNDGIHFGESGRTILTCDYDVEHGLGRPQICEFNDIYFVFFTRRFLNFKYGIGVARSNDLINWKRIDNWLDTIQLGQAGEFDSDMIYFPAFINTGTKQYLFYVGNGYGMDGFGYAELKKKNI